MAVNLTNLTAVDSFYDMAIITQEATNNVFFGLILVAFFFILVMNLRKQGVGNAMAGASFSCSILSLILLQLGLVQILFPIVFVLVLAGSLFYLRFSTT